MRTIFLISLVLLSGCGLKAAKDELDASKQALLSCLATKGAKNPDLCTAEAVRYQIAESEMNRRDAAMSQLGAWGHAQQSYQQPQMQPQPQMWMQNMGNRTYQCNNIGGTVNCF